MAMSMQELFHGESEPVYYAQYARSVQNSSLPYYYNVSSHAAREDQVELPEDRTAGTTFDLMVPMCCTRCEEQVREALFRLGGVRDVVCDAYNQRVTVAGDSYLDPVQALKQAKRVKRGATFWPCTSITGSSHSKHRSTRYETFSYQKSTYRVHDAVYRRRYAQAQYVGVDAREYAAGSNPDRYNDRSSAGRDSYSRSFCPAYRDSVVTCFVSVNPTIATRVELEC